MHQKQVRFGLVPSSGELCNAQSSHVVNPEQGSLLSCAIAPNLCLLVGANSKNSSNMTVVEIFCTEANESI